MSTNQHSKQRRRLFDFGPWGVAWLTVCMVAVSSLCWRGAAHSAANTSHSVERLSAVHNASTHESVRPRLTKSIERIQVGERVFVDLPASLRELAIGDPALVPDWDRLETEIDPSAWRRLALRMTGVGGDCFEISLLRPLSWIEQNGAAPGGTFQLVVREQGLDGPAEVLAIESCPSISAGRGGVVTGTFTHIRGGILSLYLEDVDEPIDVTSNHSVYSVDKDEFVQAGQLRLGERLRHLEGITRVAHIEPVLGEQRVYNLEIRGEHVYHVTTGGVLVHNASAQQGSYTNTYASGKTYHGKGPKARSQASGKRIADQHTDPHVATDWKPASSHKQAFIDEAARIAGDENGVANPNNYNIRNSPGRKWLPQ